MKVVRPKSGASFTLTVGTETITIHNQGRGQVTLGVEAGHRVTINAAKKRKYVKRFFG